MNIKSVFAVTEKGKTELSFQNGAYIADGITVSVKKTEKSEIHAYTVNAESDVPFDKFCALELCFEADENTRYCSNYRHSDFWCMPVFCDNASEIPEKTQCLITEKDGVFGCVLPVCSKQYLANVKGTESGDICVYMQSLCAGLTRCDGLAFAEAKGDMPYKLIEDCAEYALQLLGTGVPLRRERRYPELFEYLGWCSWDAFMTGVSEEKLLQKCEEFKQKNIPVKWAIIDDMWADVPGLERSVGVERREMFKIMHSSRLASFNADPKRFPNNLSGCISKMKEYGMKVGMWHPTTGYWKGVTEDGEIMKAMPEVFIKSGYYSTRRNEYDEKEMLVHSPEFEKAFKFYDDWHSFFEKSGAEFIKVDNQSFTHRIYHDIMPLGEVASNLHKAIECSASIHFDNTMINCMGAAAENMWNRPQSAVSRCSDDFQPENRDWFTKHILQCSYNCLVQGVFHYGDWDMWWTDDSQAVKNSVLRAISGGPIYVSDTLDRSRAEILKPLCFDDGRILRTDRPATPTNRCIMSNPETSGEPFVVWSNVDGGAVAAVFNLDSENNKICGKLTLNEIPNLVGEKFAVYDYFNKTAFIATKEQQIDLQLCDRDDFRLYTIVPISDGIGFIGLADKMTSAKAILNQSKNAALLYQGGEIAFVSEKPVTRVTVDGVNVTPKVHGVLCTVNYNSDKNVLITVE